MFVCPIIKIFFADHVHLNFFQKSVIRASSGKRHQLNHLSLRTLYPFLALNTN
jgi:hypothetical protein